MQMPGNLITPQPINWGKIRGRNLELKLRLDQLLALHRIYPLPSESNIRMTTVVLAVFLNDVVKNFRLAKALVWHRPQDT